MLINERITENLIRDALDGLGYKSADNDIVVEEQKSQIVDVIRLLKSASKSGSGGRGSPEFIISSPSTPDFLVIMECKALVKFHESIGHTKPVEYAVDGAVHYGRILSKSYNVVAIAASGQSLEGLTVSAHVFSKGSDKYTQLKNEAGLAITELIPFDDFVRLASYDTAVAKSRHEDLMAFSRDLHDFTAGSRKVDRK